jgi:ATP-dependent DNA helicase RecQ
VLQLLEVADGPLRVTDVQAQTGIGRGLAQTLLTTMRVDGAVDKIDGGWIATGTGWSYDQRKYDKLVTARRAEAELMREYAEGRRCLMNTLVEALDDPTAGMCGRCSYCTGLLPAPGAAPSDKLTLAARGFLAERGLSKWDS